MLVLRYRSSTKTTLAQEVTFEQFHPTLVAIGVLAVVMGICGLVMAIISEVDGVFAGCELYASLLICIGVLWTIGVEAITQHRAFEARRGAARKPATSHSDDHTEVYTIESSELACPQDLQLQQQQQQQQQL